ncbi:response regulator [Chryseobacterium fluminis]|uniref:response regulator n=1 Tax=Chryseobacterium fluminis TaxID=2983606 RepID=UPI0022562247|nr:response regulator [Chryseobacterium sp. MMS21-Ot14]UZT96262.1 response regulator [Chryseobacterium sp. MMS21-Ot14]
MFKKVLIVEDQEIMNQGILNTIKELNIPDFDYVTYCDEALSRIRTSLEKKNPYDLLIADLSFDKDHIPQKLLSGQELIFEVKKVQPDLKVVVFSVEKKAKTIDDLYKIYQVDGFVSKARRDGQDLKSTIRKIFNGETVIPQEVLNTMRHISSEFDMYDIKLLELLAKGNKQSEISTYLKEHRMMPYGIRSIEKRLNELRDSLGAKNNIEMIVICKDIGLI